jgi:hypothetical protein
MHSIGGQPGLERLREANQYITEFFARFSGAPVQGSKEEVQEMLRLANTLRSVGALLDGRSRPKQGEIVRDELARYRANLLRLQAELGSLQPATAGARGRFQVRQRQPNASKAGCGNSPPSA